MWESGLVPDLLPGGKAASAQAWLFQTWVEVRNRTDAVLSTTLPDEGVIITLSNFLPPAFRASKNQFITAVVADFLPHPGAQLQILQNAAHARRLPGSIFMPHWPQPNLIPRNPARGDCFETLAYLGDQENLAPELQSGDFQRELHNRTGIQIELRNPDRWHDYSDVDAVLGIRDFSKACHLHKPATKLYNSWLAGVPFITGRDSACAAEGTHGMDYLRAKSPADLINCLELLKNDIPQRRRLVAEGQKKSASRSRDAVRELWLDLLGNNLNQHACQNTFSKMAWQKQRLVFWLDRLFRN